MMTVERFQALTAQSRDTISAKVLADSLHPDGETRLTTMELTYPRFIHAEFMTHRVFSRNSASSRAIPIGKMIDRLQRNPVFPLHWGKNEKGMQASEELTEEQKHLAAEIWMQARDSAIREVNLLDTIGIHKQLGNRLLEPWMWITVIASATNYEHLFSLRCHKDAEPHFQHLSYKMRDAYDLSQPRQLQFGEWHLPMIGMEGDDSLQASDLPYVSAGRCARVSYLTHAGMRDPQADIELCCQRLARQTPMHASPLEHPAECLDKQSAKVHRRRGWGNFAPGFLQLRKNYSHEFVEKRAA